MPKLGKSHSADMYCCNRHRIGTMDCLGNTALMLNKFSISSERLPASFSGFRIAQISDLHNTEFGENNETLLQMLSDCKPDIIVITGDLIDASHTDVDVAHLRIKICQDCSDLLCDRKP